MTASVSLEGARPTRPSYAQGIWFSGGLIALAGLALLFSGIFQTSLLPGWVDAGIYLGYALNLPALTERYGLDAVTYHGSRLSYVLLRYLLHRVFAPEAAQSLEVAGVYLLSISAVFAIGWQRCGAAATRFVAAFLAFNPLFISSVVFGGTDGVTVCYLLAAAAALFSPGGVRLDAGFLALGGIFAGCALIAHLFAVVPLAGIGAAHLWVSRPALRRLPYYGWALLGVLGSVVCCGIIGHAFGLDFFFFSYSMQMAGRSLQGMGTAYELPLGMWLFGAYRVLIPLFLLAFSGLLLLRRRELRSDRFLTGSFLGLALTGAIYLAWDVGLHGVVIQTRPYFNLLLPGVVLNLLGLGGALLRGAGAARGLWPLVLVPAVVIGSLSGFLASLSQPVVQRAVAAVLLAAFAGLVAAVWRGRAGGGWPTVFLTILLAGCAALNADSLRVYRAATGLDYRAAYLGSVRFVQWLETSRLAPAKPKLWFEREALNRRQQGRGTYALKFRDTTLNLNYFDTLGSLYLWHRSLLSDRLELSDEAVLAGRGTQVIVFLTQDPTQIDRARAQLAEHGIAVREVGAADYEAPAFGWHARAFARTTASGSAEAAGDR